ncbi:MAG: hypothetical protein RBJ76_13320 [Stenomitos frigidus ULC029]
MQKVMTLTPNDIKKFARDPANRALASEQRTLQAKAKKIRQEIDALYQPIFDQYTFLKRNGDRITYAEDHLYQCDDEALVAQYYNEIHAAVQAGNYGVDEGHCPALVAEHAIVVHEWKILDAMATLMGTERPGDLDLMAESVNLFLKIVEGD